MAEWLKSRQILFSNFFAMYLIFSESVKIMESFAAKCHKEMVALSGNKM